MNATTSAPMTARTFEVPPHHVPRVAPAFFIGYQNHFAGGKRIELWNLTEDIPGHCKDSTVSRQTLLKAGFVVPVPPEEVAK